MPGVLHRAPFPRWAPGPGCRRAGLLPGGVSGAAAGVFAGDRAGRKRCLLPGRPEWPGDPLWWSPRHPRPSSPLVPPWSLACPAVCLGTLLGHPLLPYRQSRRVCLRWVVPSAGPQVPLMMHQCGPRLVPPGQWQGTCDLRARWPRPPAPRWVVSLMVPGFARMAPLQSGPAWAPVSVRPPLWTLLESGGAGLSAPRR